MKQQPDFRRFDLFGGQGGGSDDPAAASLNSEARELPINRAYHHTVYVTYLNEISACKKGRTPPPFDWI
jgi:hypothetical protein